MEQRESEGTITIKSLRDAAAAMNLNLVYGFARADKSLEKTIEDRARKLAHRIVQRTSVSMKLEDQENSIERQNAAFEELAEELKRELSKSLWD